MEKYDSYHSKDQLLEGKFDSQVYCNDLSAEEKAMVPFLSFPIIKECNFSCLYCGRDGEATGSSVDCISVEKLQQFIAIARNQSIQKFRITGGEPFLHPDISRILELFNSTGCYTLINTNGSLITDYTDVINSLDPSTMKFAISLDSLDESRFNRIARPRYISGTFSKVMSAVEYLASKRFLLRINMVVGSHNLDEVDAMIRFCQAHNCDLKLLDIVSVPIPFGERTDYFVDLTALEQSLEKNCDHVISHVYTKSFGVPCVKYQFGNTKITVKNGSKGTHYDRDGVCRKCKFFPCHEGLYDIFVLSDGRICPCRWTEDQISNVPEEQLKYLIKSFQRASFYVGLNNIQSNMNKRDDLI